MGGDTVDGFDGAALVDGDVDEHAAALHAGDHLIGHKDRRTASRNKHAADDHVSFFHGPCDIEGVAHERLNAAAENIVKICEPLGIHIDDGYVSTHADRDLYGAGADRTAADDDNMPFLHARNAGKQDASAAADRRFQKMRSYLNSHTSCNLTHAGKQRESTVFQLHGFIGDADDLLSKKGFGLLRVGGKMQVGEKDLALVEEIIFSRKRFLDFDDHLRSIKDFLCGIQDPGAVFDILFIGKTAAESGTFLDKHAVACFFEGIDHCRGNADTAFLGLDLSGAANNHDRPPYG